MLRDYEMDVLRVEADGSVTVLTLELEGDADTSFGGPETGTTWRLDGKVLATNPQLNLCSVDAQTFFGPFTFGSALTFTVDGTVYVIPRGIEPQGVSALSNIVVSSTIQTNFIGSTGTLQGADIRQTHGLLVSRDFVGNITGVSSGLFVLLDDDRVIDLGAASEAGQAPILLAGSTGNVVDLSDTSTSPQRMQLVEVECTLSGGGTATFQAILNDSNLIQSTLLPLTGSVDVFDVAAITSITVLSNTLDGMNWSDFGFGVSRFLTDLTGAPDRHDGNYMNERIRGLAGDDTLFGAHGEDLLDGGVGADSLFGGMNDDSLVGRGGRDTLSGDLGNDTVDGGGQNDQLAGGDGKDRLSGGKGADTLTDGKGSDTLAGGAGADVFVLHDDNRRDVVSDFRNGVDLLDLGVGFGALTITDIAPGEVLIEYRGDSLTLRDTAGLLTAADITQADFI